MVCTSLISFDKYRCFDIKCHTIWIRILENIREELQTCILLCTTVGGSSCITALCSFLSYFVYHLLSYLREISLTETTISIDLDFFFFFKFSTMCWYSYVNHVTGAFLYFTFIWAHLFYFVIVLELKTKNQKQKAKTKPKTKSKTKSKNKNKNKNKN